MRYTIAVALIESVTWFNLLEVILLECLAKFMTCSRTLPSIVKMYHPCHFTNDGSIMLPANVLVLDWQIPVRSNAHTLSMLALILEPSLNAMRLVLA